MSWTQRILPKNFFTLSIQVLLLRAMFRTTLNRQLLKTTQQIFLFVCQFDWGLDHVTCTVEQITRITRAHALHAFTAQTEGLHLIVFLLGW